MSQPAFRFAPSPTGALHLGHAYSALLNAKLATEAKGRFLVRIEDIDWLRCPRHLADAVLEDLAWLGLVWEEPVRFQSDHLADYRKAQDRLAARGLLYPCFCSRSEVAAKAGDGRDPEGQPLYPGTCRRLDETGRWDRMARGEAHALRLDMAKALEIAGNTLSFQEKSETVSLDPGRWGDVILARKDIGTSYHVAVVVDDALQGISHVVRGQDLFEATAIHRLLQQLLSLPVPHYRHHRLISDDLGHKLSKTAKSRSLRNLREEGVTPREIKQALGFDDQ